jgi:hypothetical protein
MHDWTRVIAGTYHDFHCCWLAEIKNRLNVGVLPEDHYAQVEQVMEGVTTDVLTLRTDPPSNGSLSHNGSSPHNEVDVAVALAPPRTRFRAELDLTLCISRTRHIVIRHVSDHRMIALIELISPSNKASEYPFHTFLSKTLAALVQKIHVLLIDPFPPTPRDPQGIHAALVAQLGQSFTPPADKPLTLASYAAGEHTFAHIEPIAVGDSLPAMPLFLTTQRYIPIPLEETYTQTYRFIPRFYRKILEQPAT